MIVQEEYKNIFVRHYSDEGFKIKKVGTEEEYYEAIDLAPCLHLYEETDEKIEPWEPGIDYYAQHYKTLLDTVAGETGDEE